MQEIYVVKYKWKERLISGTFQPARSEKHYVDAWNFPDALSKVPPAPAKENRAADKITIKKIQVI